MKREKARRRERLRGVLEEARAGKARQNGGSAGRGLSAAGPWGPWVFAVKSLVRRRSFPRREEAHSPRRLHPAAVSSLEGEILCTFHFHVNKIITIH